MEGTTTKNDFSEQQEELIESPLGKRIKMDGNTSIQIVPLEKKMEKKNKHRKTDKQAKKKQKPLRASYQALVPVKFLNPYKLYRYFCDFVIYEEGHSFYMCPDLFNLFKLFTKVTVSTKYPMLQVHIQENNSFSSPPVEYTIERWKSFGNQEALDWSTTIKKLCDSYTTNYQNVYQFISQMPTHIRIQNEELALNLMKNYNVSGGKLFITKAGFIFEEFTVSDNFLKMIGFPKDKYISYVLKFGYLNWLFNQNTYQRSHIEFYLKTIFEIKTYRYESPQTEHSIINFKRKVGIPVFSKSYILAGVEGARPYIWTLIAYSENKLKKEVELPPLHDIRFENPLDKAEEIDDKQKLFDLLTTYYNANYPREAELLEKNRCKIRYLKPKSDINQLEIDINPDENNSE